MVIVERNIIYVSINKSILYVDMIYICIKYQYFYTICFLHSCQILKFHMVISLTSSCLYHLKVYWSAQVSNSVKDYFKSNNMFFTNKSRIYNILWFPCQMKLFFYGWSQISICLLYWYHDLYFLGCPWTASK